MGKCCSKAPHQRQHKKQNKDIDDCRMFEISIEILNKDFNVQLGYNRRAKKHYSDVSNLPNTEIQEQKEEEPIACNSQRLVSVFTPEEEN